MELSMKNILSHFRIGILFFILTSISFAENDSPNPPRDGLRVMVWNVLRGGNDVNQGAEKALAVIRSENPDIVLLQESYDIKDDRPHLGAWLAGELGWNQYQGESTHLCVLTPLEIDTEYFHDKWHGVGARLKDAQQREFIAWSIWLDYRAFIGYEIRDNPTMDDTQLRAAETERSNRLKEVEALLAHIKDEGHLSVDIPLLVGGDWNCPSHLDWTLDTERVFKHRRHLPLPVSKAMIDHGFEDTYRTVHPNPVQHPGITWSPMYRGPQPGETGTAQSFDRIDRLYIKNPDKGSGWTLRPVSGYVLPHVWEDDVISREERQFPSDHGAVVIDLMWVKKP
jgi:exonuclease III